MDNLLLFDENSIPLEDIKRRKELVELFQKLPRDFLSKMRCFQPQIGCSNKCGFCSQYSATKVESFDLRTLKNIIAAIKVVALTYTQNTPLLAWDRIEHRVGVIFPYLDNDVGGYKYLYEYIKYIYHDLNTLTRISTVGFSRKNRTLNKMHKKIINSDCINGLGGCRLSISQFGRAWEDCSGNFNLDEYKKDLINFLKIYKPYYTRVGAGSRDFCVELRFNPLVRICNVLRKRFDKRLVLSFGNNIFISKEKSPKILEARIQDSKDHFLNFTQPPTLFYHIKNETDILTSSQLKQATYNFLENIEKKKYSEVECYLFKNAEGIYYSIDPKLTEKGNYGLNIYLKTAKRKVSGILSTERFLLNSMTEVKKKYHLTLNDDFDNFEWKDIRAVIISLKKNAVKYNKLGDSYKSEYIMKNVLPIVELYAQVLKSAKYSPNCFFDKNFTIDTGTICNLGRGIKYFKGLVSKENEPLTPVHERNYGRISSTMTTEHISWRLRCYYKNLLEVQKVNLKKVSFNDGPVIWQKRFANLSNNDEFNYEKKTDYTVPGEV